MKEEKIAEVQDVRLLSLGQIEKDGSAFCSIKGLLFHSAMVVERVDLHRAESVMQVRVVMALTRPGQSGAFDIDIPLSGGIKSIVFGDAHTPIWNCIQGPIHQEAVA
ncbi:MAG: hypothetical protein V4641_06295 [Pseudomonadota bacterium]